MLHACIMSVLFNACFLHVAYIFPTQAIYMQIKCMPHASFVEITCISHEYHKHATYIGDICCVCL